MAVNSSAFNENAFGQSYSVCTNVAACTGSCYHSSYNVFLNSYGEMTQTRCSQGCKSIFSSFHEISSSCRLAFPGGENMTKFVPESTEINIEKK